MRGFYISFFVILSSLTQIFPAKAESEAACAIWLCLPGGFPSGCSAAYSEFKHRIKKGRPPLPSLSSCVVGPDGSRSNGSYQMGVEYFLPCKDGFEFSKSPQESYESVMCLPIDSQCNLREKYRRDKKMDCTPYPAERRTQPRFIKMWVDGKYLGQFFYQ
ncbi:MAG TPA: hypothetical protein DCM27_05270 [Rhodospirillaceae bacterium]|nr:hypothetical protein [Rhodospirillaceae bacterium]